MGNAQGTSGKSIITRIGKCAKDDLQVWGRMHLLWCSGLYQVYFGSFPRLIAKNRQNFWSEAIRPNFSCSNSCNSPGVCSSFLSLDTALIVHVAPGRITLRKTVYLSHTGSFWGVQGQYTREMGIINIITYITAIVVKFICTQSLTRLHTM